MSHRQAIFCYLSKFLDPQAPVDANDTVIFRETVADYKLKQ